VSKRNRQSKSSRLKLGGHLGAKEGLRYVVVAARALNYNVVQIMLGGGRDYYPYEINPKDQAEYKKMTYGIETWVHLPYIINPCESIPQRIGFYKRTYKAYCVAASELGARGIVIHPGYKKDLSEEVAYKNLLKFFESTHEEAWDLNILLETDSGSKNGSAIGTLELINNAITDLDHDQFGICLDTVHLYARGVDIWELNTRDQILSKYGHKIRLVHLNSPDPKVALGNFLDRHNTPFEDRPWDHFPMIKALAARYPLVLERSSLSVQEQDAKYVRGLLEKE